MPANLDGLLKVLHEKLGSGREYIRWITASQGKQQGYGVISECPQILRSNT